MAAASVGVAKPPRIEPRMNTGSSAARNPSRNALSTMPKPGRPSPFGSPLRRAVKAMTPMQMPQISSPGRMPAANSPAMETPMIEP